MTTRHSAAEPSRAGTRLIREVSVQVCAVAWLICVLMVHSAAAQVQEKRSGYLEWPGDTEILIDGQTITTGTTTRWKAPAAMSSLREIPLRSEVTVRGVRLPDGRIRAEEIRVKANGTEAYEQAVIEQGNAAEREWVGAGGVYMLAAGGRPAMVGRVVTDGPLVDRTTSVLRRLSPTSVTGSSLRVRVVETAEWNAMVLGNGSVWVYSGLLAAMDDDELSVVLGHELAHYTHEHARKSAARLAWIETLSAVANASLSQVKSAEAQQLAAVAASLSVSALVSGFSRNDEDQADRVGLRYAHQAGFDVSAGVRVWEKFRDRYGEEGRLTNFFVGDHSRPSDRIRNLRTELSYNYRAR